MREALNPLRDSLHPLRGAERMPLRGIGLFGISISILATRLRL